MVKLSLFMRDEEGFLQAVGRSGALLGLVWGKMWEMAGFLRSGCYEYSGFNSCLAMLYLRFVHFTKVVILLSFFEVAEDLILSYLILLHLISSNLIQNRSELGAHFSILL